jgi:hypothetical protein
VATLTGTQIVSAGLGHFVAVKCYRNKRGYTFRIIDFQIKKDVPGREIQNELPPDAVPPFYLFEKISYK